MHSTITGCVPGYVVDFWDSHRRIRNRLTISDDDSVRFDIEHPEFSVSLSESFDSIDEFRAFYALFSKVLVPPDSEILLRPFAVFIASDFL